VVTVNSNQERKKVDSVGAVDEIKCEEFLKGDFGLRVRTNADEMRLQ
jgi:hypothetical protein